MKKLLSFSLDDIQLYEDDDNQDFAIAKLAFLSDGNNSHKNPISLEVLKRDASTALGKFVIGEYNMLKTDTTTHTNNEQIYGYVPPNGKISFETKDNKTFAICDAVISKLYALPIVDMFKKDNQRWVSCEFTAELEKDEDLICDGEDNPILGFNIRGITILGKQIKPSCAGAEMKMMKFSEKDAEGYYNTKHNTSTVLKEFAERRRERMAGKTIKVNKTELKETPWRDVDKTALKDKVMAASNRDTLVKDVYALVEDGWEDAPSEHLKYPIMEISGDTAYYNRYGLAAALAYAKKENVQSVVDKVEKLYKKFKIDEEGDEKKMSESKKFASNELEGRPLYAEVIKRIHDKLGDHLYVEGIYSDKIVVRNEKTKELMDIPADIKLGKDDEDMKIEIDYDGMKKSKVQKDFSEKKKMEDDDAHSTDEKDKEEVDKDKKDDGEEHDEEDEDARADDDEEEDKEKMSKSSKKMSLDSYAESAALLEMLENETEEYRDLANDVLKEMADEDKTIIMKRVIGMAKELTDLRKFKCDKEMEAKQFEVNKTLMEVKEDLSEKEFEDLKEEGMACKFEDMSAFQNKVKAFAFDKKKGVKVESTNKQFAKMAFAFDSYLDKSTSEMSADEILKKYL